ncbi:hypothetical protein E6H34_00500 [Candidatus Bathyarchaeota archaeon]|nr:MAG: hypothetical protein E6H34_00500 [Candidatus Bathyarchaeota archaeon]
MRVAKSTERLFWKRIPWYAKIIILVETVMTLFLSFWIYQEYVNNRYLRTYVDTSLQAEALAAKILVSIGLSIIAMVLFAKWRRYRNELNVILSRETFRPAKEGLIKRGIRELKDILSKLFGKLRR